MKMLSLDEIKKEVEKLCWKIGINHKQYPKYGIRTDDGSAHIEIDATDYCYVITERGYEYSRKKTGEIDELLFWIMRDVTFDCACEYELNHRDESQDFRRMLFAKKLELLTTLSPDWAAREKAALDAILRTHPFSDQ